MVGTGVKAGITVAAIAAIGFQVYLKDITWLGLGLGRPIQPISDFQYTCRRIQDSRIQACEDMWLSEGTRQLFLACSDPLSRREWAPSMHHLNASGRGMDDVILAMDIDKPEGDSFAYRVLSTPGFTGINGDGRLNLVGFDGLESPSDGDGESGPKITLGLVNHRPSVDPETGALLDNTKTGANSTIEIFETSGAGATELRHVRTVADPRIATPNRLAWATDDPEGGFYITNDHGQDKIGLKSRLGLLAPAGDIIFCPGSKSPSSSSSSSSGCDIVADSYKFPNGLIRSRKDGMVYVPTTGGGAVHVFKQPETTPAKLEEVAFIPVGFSIDNIYESANGDIFAATFSRSLEVIWSFKDPMNRWPTSAVIRIRKTIDEKTGEVSYTTEKVLEDRDKEVLPGATSVVHDAKTGRLFVSGVATPFIAVCEPK